jgi:hypothetical protein
LSQWLRDINAYKILRVGLRSTHTSTANLFEFMPRKICSRWHLYLLWSVSTNDRDSQGTVPRKALS